MGNNWVDATPVDMTGGEGVGWGGDSPGPDINSLSPESLPKKVSKY